MDMRLFTLIFVAVLALIPGLVLAEQEEEAAVKRVVEATADLLNAGKVESLMALYPDDAKIYNRSVGRQLSKTEHREQVERVVSQRLFSRLDVDRLKASITDSTHASVEGWLYLSLPNGARSVWNQVWFLEKRDGQWLIVESRPR
jgi:hypothetical protein